MNRIQQLIDTIMRKWADTGDMESMLIIGKIIGLTHEAHAGALLAEEIERINGWTLTPNSELNSFRKAINQALAKYKERITL